MLIWFITRPQFTSEVFQTLFFYGAGHVPQIWSGNETIYGVSYSKHFVLAVWGVITSNEYIQLHTEVWYMYVCKCPGVYLG